MWSFLNKNKKKYALPLYQWILEIRYGEGSNLVSHTLYYYMSQPFKIVLEKPIRAGFYLGIGFFASNFACALPLAGVIFAIPSTIELVDKKVNKPTKKD